MTNAQELSEIDIQKRAYNLWERGGRPENESAHFWNKAREQLILENTPDPSIQEMVQGYDYHGIKSLRMAEAYFSNQINQILNEFSEDGLCTSVRSV